MHVTHKRSRFFVAALFCLPGFAVGEALASFVTGTPADWVSVQHGFFGAFAVATALAFTGDTK